MTITFICGSLEPGRDGVGDYTIRLAHKLADLGHTVNAIALHDKFNKQVDVTAYGEIPVLRIPFYERQDNRFELVKKWISKYNSDWVSLQYVNFAFQKKGLPVELIPLLKEIKKIIKVHIMFHELWCGMAKTSGKKEKVLGWLQKNFTKLFLKMVKPLAVSTSISPYALKLHAIRTEARVIPIFGNIPLIDDTPEEEWQLLIKRFGLDQLQSSDYLVVAFFGSIYPCLGLADLLNDLYAAAQILNKKIAALSIGHGKGQSLDSLFKEIPDKLIIQTGALSEGLVNKVMQLADLAVITSPVDGIDKSGGAIAWIDRGIPVIYSKQDTSGEEKQLESRGVFRVTGADQVLKAINIKPKLTERDSIEDVADAYIKFLQASASCK